MKFLILLLAIISTTFATDTPSVAPSGTPSDVGGTRIFQRSTEPGVDQIRDREKRQEENREEQEEQDESIEIITDEDLEVP